MVLINMVTVLIMSEKNDYSRSSSNEGILKLKL